MQIKAKQLSVNGDGLVINPQQAAVNLSTPSGLNLAGTTPGKTLEIADTVAGDGLVINQKIIAVGAGTGIIVEADDVKIDPAVVVRKHATTINGDNNTSTFTVTHGLNTTDVTAMVWQMPLPYALVTTDISVLNVNSISIIFKHPPTSGTNYRVVVHG